MKPPIFIELCAGTAALSLRLQGGPKAKPPVSRMGAKTGYADAILAVLGLYPGQGAESYLWCEPDDGVRGLLMAYPQPEVLRAAAKILRGWKDEEPRALWERLRAELKAGASVEGAEEVARYAFVAARTMPQATGRGEVNTGDFLQRIKADGTQRYPEDHPAGVLDGMPPFPPVTIVADGRVVTPEDARRLLDVRPQAARTNEADRHRLDAVTRGEDFIGLRGRPDGPHGVIVEFGLGVFDPDLRGAVRDLVRDVLLLSAPLKISGGVVCAGAVDVSDDVTGLTWAVERLTYQGTHPAVDTDSPGAEYEFAVAVLIDAADKWLARVDRSNLSAFRDFVLGGFLNNSPFHSVTSCYPIAYGGMVGKLPPEVIVFCDPPYLNTTGYKHDLPRSEVVRMARLWADAGATVCISEAEPIPELMADGWHAVEISATRRGAKRTFTGQQKMAKKKQPAEWLTLSRPPSFVPRETLDLFG